MSADFSMYAGDSRTIDITVTDAAGDPVDVSDAQAIRFGLFDGGAGALVTKTLGAGITVITNTITITLAPADTAGLRGNYIHETEITDIAGLVHTALQGSVTILRDYLT